MNPGNDKSKSFSGVRGHHEPRKRIHHKPRKRIYYGHFQGLDIWDWIFPHADFTNKFSFPTWEWYKPYTFLSQNRVPNVHIAVTSFPLV